MWRRWDHWWFRPVPPHALALCRIAFGLFLLFYVAVTYLPHLTLLFSSEGFQTPLFLSSSSPLFIVPTPGVVIAIAVALLVALVGFTLGYGMRLSAIVILLIGLWAWQISFHDFSTSYLRLFGLLLAVFACSGADRTLSLRMRLKQGSWFAWEPISILPQRLIAVQLAATYLGVGWQKVWLPEWQGGEVLAYSFVTRWATAPAYWLVRLNLPIWFYDFSVLLVKLFETTLPFGLWMKSVQRWYMLGGLFFHLFITVFLGIWWFLVLPPLYVVFLDPERVRQIIELYVVGRKVEKSKGACL